MKKLIILSICSIAMGIACTPKAAKTTSSGSTGATLMTKEMANQQYSADQLVEGKAIFTANCGRCHKLHQPGQFTSTKWHSVLNKMIPKAKLAEDQGKLVRAYLVANSKTES